MAQSRLQRVLAAIWPPYRRRLRRRGLAERAAERDAQLELLLATARLRRLGTDLAEAVGRTLTMDEIGGLEGSVMAVATAEPDRRVEIGVAGLGRWGLLLVRYTEAAIDLLPGALGEEAAIPYRAVGSVYRTVVDSWYRGHLVTERADEVEARARMMLEFLDENVAVARLAAGAVVALPPGHPRRDLDRVVDGLHRLIVESLDMAAAAPGDAEATRRAMSEVVTGISGLVDHSLVPEARAEQLITVGEAIAASPELGEISRFHRAAANHLVLRARAADRAGDKLTAERLNRRAAVHLTSMVEEAQDEVAAAAVRGLLEAVGGTDRDAEGAPEPTAPPKVSMMPERLAGTRVGHEGLVLFAKDRARRLLAEGDPNAAVDALDEVLESLEDRYVGAVRDEDVAWAGESYADALSLAAAAKFETGDVDGAFAIIDLAKSLRFRYQAELRSSPLGDFLRDLETDIHAVSRGLAPPHGWGLEETDPAGQLSSLLETYRQTREKVGHGGLARPSLAELAAVLDENEAAVVLGEFGGGLAVAVVLPGRDEPAHVERIGPDQLAEFVATLLSTNGGWVAAIGTRLRLGVDPGKALVRCLDVADRLVARPVAASLREQAVRRLTIVPHGVWQLVPFWALPAFNAYQVMVAPSAAQVLSARVGRRTISDRALVVGDPTKDLPLAGPEARRVADLLSGGGSEVVELEGSLATQEAVRAAAAGVGVLHFAGHGRSDFSTPVNSALETHPRPRGHGQPTDELLTELAADAEWREVHRLAGSTWVAMETVRQADIPGQGRLERRYWPSQELVELRLDHGPTGTLFGQYALTEEGGIGRPLRCAELWSAGDLLVDGALSGCGLVVLSSCEVGLTAAASTVDEYSGLPAALTLAGVGAVVSPMWEIRDDVALVFSDLFYRMLVSSGAEPSVLDVVDDTRHRLRRMGRQEAIDILESIRAAAESPRQLIEIDTAAARLAAGPDHPFAHPLHWAAFHLTGAERLAAPFHPPGDAEHVPAEARVFELPEVDAEPAVLPQRSSIEQLADHAETVLAAVRKQVDGEPAAAITDLAADWLTERAAARAAAGRTDDAAADFERVIELDPDRTAGWLGLAGVRLAQQRPEDALGCYDEVLERDHDNLRARLLGASLRAVLGDVEAALADLDRFADHPDPTVRFVAQQSRASILAMAEAHEDVLAVAAEALDLQPEHAELWALRSRAAFELRRFEEAVGDATRALVLDPLNDGYRVDRGLALLELGDVEAAVADYTAALETNPDNVAAVFNRACARSRGEQPDGVVADLERAFELDPDLRVYAATETDLTWARAELADVVRLLGLGDHGSGNDEQS